MRRFSVWPLLALFSLFALRGLAQEFSLTDAFDESSPAPPATPKPKPNNQPGGGGTGGDFKLEDFFDKKPTPKPPVVPKDPVKPQDPVIPKDPVKPKDPVIPKDPVKPKGPVKPTAKPKQEEIFSDSVFRPTVLPDSLPNTSSRPLRSAAPPLKAGLPGFELSDALPPENDPQSDDKGFGGGHGRPSIGGGQNDKFTDDDLADVGKDDSYRPDKGKGGRPASADEGDYDTMAETGTIAGIVSAVSMALLGAVSSYISYQKKKFCFSIQQSLNADMVKAENPEAVVAQEPQVQQTLLQPPNAEPPTDDNVV